MAKMTRIMEFKCRDDYLIRFRTQQPDGYVRLTTYSKKSILEHNYVWQKANGPIPDGYYIHHINRMQNDNRLENLLLVDRAEHKKEHWNDHFFNFEAGTERECIKCKTTKPPSAFSGVSNICSFCQRLNARERYRNRLGAKPSENLLDGATKYKFSGGHLFIRCAMCKKYLPKETFSSNSSMKFGVGSYCKKCASEYQKRYQAKKGVFLSF